MLDTNKIVLSFIQNNSIVILLVLFLFSLLSVIPPEWCGFWKFNNNDEKQGRASRVTILNWMLNMIIDSLIRSFVLSPISAFGLKNMVTMIIFIVTGFDIFNSHQVSSASVVLISIGIIVLYLDKLVETGKEISIFGRLLHWKKAED